MTTKKKVTKKEEKKANTYLHKFKCMECGLHFIVCTWEKAWDKKESVHCPECGNNATNFLHWVEGSDKQIFEFVPGGAQLSM